MQKENLSVEQKNLEQKNTDKKNSFNMVMLKKPSEYHLKILFTSSFKKTKSQYEN